MGGSTFKSSLSIPHPPSDAVIPNSYQAHVHQKDSENQGSHQKIPPRHRLNVSARVVSQARIRRPHDATETGGKRHPTLLLDVMPRTQEANNQPGPETLWTIPRAANASIGPGLELAEANLTELSPAGGPRARRAESGSETDNNTCTTGGTVGTEHPFHTPTTLDGPMQVADYVGPGSGA